MSLKIQLCQTKNIETSLKVIFCSAFFWIKPEINTKLTDTDLPMKWCNIYYLHYANNKNVLHTLYQ